MDLEMLKQYQDKESQKQMWTVLLESPYLWCRLTNEKLFILLQWWPSVSTLCSVPPLESGLVLWHTQPTDCRGSDVVPVWGIRLEKTYQLPPLCSQELWLPVLESCQHCWRERMEKPHGERGPDIIWKGRRPSHPSIPAELPPPHCPAN